MTTAPTPLVPNHHASYGDFTGISGLLAGLTMVLGRGGDARLAIRLAELRANDEVVDIGSGPGTAARAGAKVGARVTGVEPAAVMLRLARRLTRRSHRVRYVEGTAEALPCPDDSASVVWSLSTVHHWADLDAGLREVRRVLRPGGRFVAIEHRSTSGATGLGSHGWTDDQAERFAALCRAGGFREARVEVPPSPRRGRPAIVVVAR